MGCGALAILGMAGCVGLTSYGTYKLDQALEEERAERDATHEARQRAEGRAAAGNRGPDPFSDYNSSSKDGEMSNDWGNEAN